MVVGVEEQCVQNMQIVLNFILPTLVYANLAFLEMDSIALVFNYIFIYFSL